MTNNFLSWFDNTKDIRKSHHYSKEITRYWNTINYISSKTLRSFRDRPKISKKQKDFLYYLVYRKFWERAPDKTVINEINRVSSSEELKKFFLDFYKRLSNFDWTIALRGKSIIEQQSIRNSIPTFSIEKLLPVMTLEEIVDNFKAMDQRINKGKYYLRINNLVKGLSGLNNKKNEIVDYFRKKYGIILTPESNYPYLVSCQPKDRSIIIQSTYYKTGEIIFHDKASVAIVNILRPKLGDFICDLCAAPGVKTSLLAQLSSNEATIIAGDVNDERVDTIPKLLQKLHVRGVHVIRWDGINPPTPKGVFNKILIDAPCSGSGNFSSNPELKWKQNTRFLDRMVFFQSKLLQSALTLLKPGGVLIYATCSLYPEEGEYQIKRILDKVELIPLPSTISSGYKSLGIVGELTGRFFPKNHGTDGFFVAKMIKKESY